VRLDPQKWGPADVACARPTQTRAFPWRRRASHIRFLVQPLSIQDDTYHHHDRDTGLQKIFCRGFLDGPTNRILPTPSFGGDLGKPMPDRLLSDLHTELPVPDSWASRKTF
jgi:hypothetical protein